jgi:hypothetical protein
VICPKNAEWKLNFSFHFSIHYLDGAGTFTVAFPIKEGQRAHYAETVPEQYFWLVTTILLSVYLNNDEHLKQTGDQSSGVNLLIAENTKPDMGSSHYQIIVEGELGVSWSEWLGDAVLESHYQANGSQKTTILGAVPDQAALRGLLNKIWDLNLTLISVNKQED